MNKRFLVRIIRLVAAIGIGIYAIMSGDYVFLILTAILLLQALFNISCCGVRRCSRNNAHLDKDEIITKE